MNTLTRSLKRFAGHSKNLMSFKVTLETNKLTEPKVTVDGFKGAEIPNPPAMTLAALAVCEQHTALYHAKKLGLKVTQIDFKNVTGSLDMAGFKGVEGYKPDFVDVTLDAEVHGDLSDADVEKLAKVVHDCCPIYNLFKQAGVKVNGTWKKAAN